MAGDASAYVASVVISHLMPDVTEHPITFTSQTLSPAELNHAQFEKESLPLIFVIHKFDQYHYDQSFTIITNHKLLMIVLSPKQGIPTLSAARMQKCMGLTIVSALVRQSVSVCSVP